MVGRVEMKEEENAAIKNVLIITDSLYPRLNANSQIAYQISSYLKKEYGYNIYMMGMCQQDEVKINDDLFGFKTVNIEVLEKKRIIGNEKNKVIKLIRLLMNPMCLFCHIRMRRNIYIARRIEYERAIKRLLSREKFDCVIGFAEPFYILEAIAKVKSSVPFIAYELDPKPSELDFVYRSNNINREIEQFVESEAAGIVLTNLQYNIHKNITYGNDKYFSLDFPCVEDLRDRLGHFDIQFDNQRINCVFAGRLYETIRNPHFTLEIFRAMEDKNITFHIIGYSEDHAVLPKPLPKNVICHGRLDIDEANAYVEHADILVNIGNSVFNLMPSKILSYISTGKPILNIVKSEECPTLEYMKIYPLVLNVFESEIVDKTELEKIYDFCVNHKNYRVPFEVIKRLYNTCTIEYVGKMVNNIVCSIIEKRKGTQ